MLLIGDGPAGGIPEFQAVAHEIIVGEPLPESAALHRQPVAETVNNKNRFRVDMIGDLGDGGFRIVPLRYHHRVTVAYSQRGRHFCVDPQRVDRHLLEQQRIIDRMPLGMQGAAPESEPECPFRRRRWRDKGLQ